MSKFCIVKQKPNPKTCFGMWLCRATLCANVNTYNSLMTCFVFYVAYVYLWMYCFYSGLNYSICDIAITGYHKN